MKKIPTIFDRDWNGDRSRVVNAPHSGCAWVFAGEGVATKKLDGSCCLVRGGKLLKRHEVKPGKAAPVGFEVADHDPETGKTVGWLPVGDGPEDRWHREAFERGSDHLRSPFNDGTHELIGPRINGNPEGWSFHTLIPHTVEMLKVDKPRRLTFEGFREHLAGVTGEGLVFHHPDGRMAKIKLRDFGMKRRPVTDAAE